MNILVITLGNSDIQIRKKPDTGFTIDDNGKTGIVLKKTGLPEITLKQNRGYPEYLLASPRKGGKLINENYTGFKDILEFPIITPLLSLFEKKDVIFHEVWWVYTDQTDATEHFKESDTLFFRSILQQYFNDRFSSLRYHDYAISKHVKNIDYQYESFYQKALNIISRREEIDKIYLLPQGGIDQINHALTLQFIQLFKEKVIIYQNAELSEPVQLKFTRLFLNDLTKHNVIKHVRDYDFDKAEDLILDNSELKKLSGYAARRLNLLHDAIDDNDLPEEYKVKWNELTEVEKRKIKLQDLVYSFKIQMRQGKYNEAIIKLFTISESMYKIEIEQYVGHLLDRFFDKALKSPGDQNEKWEGFINENLNRSYIERLKKKKVHLNNPNAMSLCYLYRWLLVDKKNQSKSKDQEIKKVNTVISDLRLRRNDIAHSLGSITKGDIDIILDYRKISIEAFYNFIDKIVFTNGLGIYENIRRKILAHYGENV